MNLLIPKITRPVPLTDYAPELVAAPVTEGAATEPITVHVWVNPPRALLDEYWNAVEAAQKAVAGAGEWNGFFADWYAQLWSQHPDSATHWTAQAVKTLAASDTDPALYVWLVQKSHELIAAHRRGEKKR